MNREILPEDYRSVYYHRDLFPPLNMPLEGKSESKALINIVIQHVEEKWKKPKYVPSLGKSSALLMSKEAMLSGLDNSTVSLLNQRW